jgi:hypothetical protein
MALYRKPILLPFLPRYLPETINNKFIAYIGTITNNVSITYMDAFQVHAYPHIVY